MAPGDDRGDVGGGDASVAAAPRRLLRLRAVPNLGNSATPLRKPCRSHPHASGAEAQALTPSRSSPADEQPDVARQAAQAFQLPGRAAEPARHRSPTLSFPSRADASCDQKNSQAGPASTPAESTRYRNRRVPPAVARRQPPPPGAPPYHGVTGDPAATGACNGIAAKARRVSIMDILQHPVRTHSWHHRDRQRRIGRLVGRAQRQATRAKHGTGPVAGRERGPPRIEMLPPQHGRCIQAHADRAGIGRKDGGALARRDRQRIGWHDCILAGLPANRISPSA